MSSQFILIVLMRYLVNFYITVEKEVHLITWLSVRSCFHRLHTVVIKLKLAFSYSFMSSDSVPSSGT